MYFWTALCIENGPSYLIHTLKLSCYAEQHIMIVTCPCVYVCNTTEYWCAERQMAGFCAWAHEFTLTRLSSLYHRIAQNYNVWKFSGIQIPFDIQTTAASSLMRSGNLSVSRRFNKKHPLLFYSILHVA